jgi:hypothetical protein
MTRDRLNGLLYGYMPVDVGAGDRVSLTEMGALLGSDIPGSMRDVALHRGGESFAA